MPDAAAGSTETGKQRFTEVQVVAPNLSFRYSGVTSTLIALLPHHSPALHAAVLSPHVPDALPRVAWREVFAGGWRRPASRPARIWHARGNHDMMAGLLLARVLRQPWRLILTSAGQRRHSRFTRALMRRMDALIATSPAAASYLERPATVIMHGVDTDRFTPASDRAAAWRETGLPGRFGVGIFGRVRPQKGTDLFVEAMLALLPARPDWTAVVIGLVTPEWRGFADALSQRAAAAGLADRIRFLGPQPVAAIPQWYRALSLVVAPPRHEGFGLVPLEAMASGTPVVASEAGAHASLVAPEYGRLVPAGDGTALSAAIAELMDLPTSEREAMGQAGRARAERDFAIAREVAGIEAVYERVWALAAAEAP